MTLSATDRAAVDASLRVPLLLLLALAALWLPVADFLSLLASATLHDVGLPVLAYGRVEAAARLAGCYGWAAGGGAAAALWIGARLAGKGLAKPLGWVVILTAVVGNGALAAGIVQVLNGRGSGIPSLELPPGIATVVLGSLAVLAAVALVGFAGRPSGTTTVAEWYLALGLIALPAVALWGIRALAWNPVPGPAKAWALAWTEAGLLRLALVPVALGTLYYTIPKLLGREVAGRGAARLGFWSFLFLAGWTGAARLAFGPAPAWVASAGIAATLALAVPVLAVAVDLLPLFRGRLGEIALGTSPALRFSGCALGCFFLFHVEAIATAFRSVGGLVHLTLWEAGRADLALHGLSGFALFGALYYLVPRLARWEWPSVRLVRLHFWGSAAGLILLVGAAGAGGMIEGFALGDPKISFAAVASLREPFLWLRSLGWLLLLAAHLGFLAHLGRVIARKGPRRDGPTLFPADGAATMPEDAP